MMLARADAMAILMEELSLARHTSDTQSRAGLVPESLSRLNDQEQGV